MQAAYINTAVMPGYYDADVSDSGGIDTCHFVRKDRSIQLDVDIKYDLCSLNTRRERGKILG